MAKLKPIYLDQSNNFDADSSTPQIIADIYVLDTGGMKMYVGKLDVAKFDGVVRIRLDDRDKNILGYIEHLI